MIRPGQVSPPRGHGGHTHPLRASWAVSDGHIERWHGNHLCRGGVGRYELTGAPIASGATVALADYPGSAASVLYGVTASGSATAAVWTVTPDDAAA